MDRGFEAHVSRRAHASGTPVLISSLVLRELGAGQVDVALMKSECLHLIECKAGPGLGRGQLNRLNNSARWLCHVLDCSCDLWLAKKILPNGIRFFTLNS